MRKPISIGSVVLLLALTFAWAADTTSVKGWVVDEKCGVKGAHAGSEQCSRKCIADGSKMVVVTDSDQQMLYVDNPDALKDHIGHHVAIEGTINGNQLHVDHAEMTAKEKK